MKLHTPNKKKQKRGSHKKKPQVSPIEFEEEENNDNKNNNKNLSEEEIATASEEKSSKDTTFIALESSSKGPPSIDNQQQQQQMKQQQLPRYNGANSHQYHHQHHIDDNEQQQYPLLIVPPDDAIDETSFDENDPYWYSDDSGSLSDAYFYPDHDSTNAVMTTFSNYNNNNHNEGQKEEEQQQRQQNYGSTTVPSRITLNGILEDSPLQEVAPLLPTKGGDNSRIHHHHHYSASSSSRKQQQKQRQRVQLIRRKQRQQEREHAVKQIRGKPQLATQCHDVIWLLLFVLQLLFVIACAIRYGWTLLRFNPSIYYSIHSSTTTTSSSSSGGHTTTRFLTATTTVSSPPPLPLSSSTTTTTTTSSLLSLRTNHRDYHPNPLQDFPNHHHNLRILRSSSSSISTAKNSTTHETSQQQQQHETPEELKDLEDDDNFEPVEIKQPSTISTTTSSSSTSASSSSSSTTTSTTTTATTVAMKGTSTNNNIVESNNQDEQSSVGANDEVNKDVPFSMDYQILIKLFWISGVYAMIISCCSLGIMLIVSRALIPLMLIFSILLAVCWGVFGLAIDPSSMISILGFVFLIASLGYALACWNRIGFCSTNLYTAICSMRDTPSVLFVGFGSLWMAVLWCWIWSVALMGILNTYNAVDCEHNQHCDTHIPEWWRESDVLIIELVVLILNLYWTMMVIKNIVRVCVAGAIGAWWFASPRQAGRCCCDNTVWGPWSRACTISLGSVCLGSLVVLPAQTISVLGNVCCWMVGGGNYSRENNLLILPPKTRQKNSNNKHLSRSGPSSSSATPLSSSSEVVSSDHPYENDEDSFQCLGFVDRLWRQVRSYNRWAYTYIGLYGYSFSKGGEKAIQLFETREWMDIVKDNLIQNVLLMASIVIGGLTGIFAVLVEEMDGYTFTSLKQPVLISFWIGTILGFVLSNILLLGVVGSAVNTVLVCYAADPFEFDKNHPVLSREMREVWSQQVWEPSVESVV